MKNQEHEFETKMSNDKSWCDFWMAKGAIDVHVYALDECLAFLASGNDPTGDGRKQNLHL